MARPPAVDQEEWEAEMKVMITNMLMAMVDP